MEICNILKSHLHFIGIFKHPYTTGDFLRVLCFSVAFHLFVISINYFLIFEANTFKDYSESFLFGFSTFSLNIQHLVLIWQRKDLMKMMDDLQDIVNESEYWNKRKLRFNEYHQLISTGVRDPWLKTIYETTNNANNKRANNFYTAMITIVTPIFSIPIACLSFYLYYFGGLEADAFQLACPES